jgi:hypothetical protein
VRGGELLLVGHVDAVEAGRDDRRRRDAHVHLRRPGLEQHPDELLHRAAPDDRVVDDHEALAGDLGEGVELHLDPLAP